MRGKTRQENPRRKLSEITTRYRSGNTVRSEGIATVSPAATSAKLRINVVERFDLRTAPERIHFNCASVSLASIRNLAKDRRMKSFRSKIASASITFGALVMMLMPLTSAFAQPSALDTYLFDQTETFAALIIKDGMTAYERHAQGFQPRSKHLFWSAAKSILVTLAGVAIREGKLRWDQSVCELMPELRASRAELCPITVEHLAFWQSGMDWSETYEKAVLMSNVVSMLYGPGARDVAGYFFAQKPKQAPGTGVNYSSGDANALSYLLRKAYGDSEYSTFVESRLSRPLGLQDFMLERDASGTIIGSSYLYSSLADMARLGALYMNGGELDGVRVLSSEFVPKVTQPHPRFTYPATPEHGELEGGSWWLNRRAPNAGTGARPWPTWPEDTFATLGHWGQALIICPSRKLIFVRTGDNRLKAPFEPEATGRILKAMGLL